MNFEKAKEEPSNLCNLIHLALKPELEEQEGEVEYENPEAADFGRSPSYGSGDSNHQRAFLPRDVDNALPLCIQYPTAAEGIRQRSLN